MKTSEEIDKITKALTGFQIDVEHPKKDTEGYGYKYAPLETVINTIRPALEEHGLAVTQSTISEGKYVGVKTILWHESGQYIEFDKLTLPRDDGQQRSGAQAAGSSITYARRYALSAALGIASEEDTDAAPRGKTKTKTRRKGKPNPKNNGKLEIKDIRDKLDKKKSMDWYNDESSEPQATRFAQWWDKKVDGDDKDRYEFLSRLLDRQIKSSTELTKGELSTLIELSTNKSDKFTQLANACANNDTDR